MPDLDQPRRSGHVCPKASIVVRIEQPSGRSALDVRRGELGKVGSFLEQQPERMRRGLGDHHSNHGWFGEAAAD
jgi:hypothetical protein